MEKYVGFVDILEPRRTQSGIFAFMTRDWYPQNTVERDKQFTPHEFKEMVANSVYMDAVIEAESIRQGVRKEKLKKDIIDYLEEMGFDKKHHTIRWMGIFFLKICFMMKIKLFVSEPSVYKLKATMGHNPVLFLPTHRSYADFCVMTYLCYHYNIEFPTVAAGMDFYSMAVVGRRMRETGAFYIRRTLAGAPLYAATLRQYVRTVVANYCAPIEFFLEGTRSRSNKSLPPKYGMLSMTLLPYFARQVPDITIVPINISYDRLMEQTLFAYEHLGVPKPKESTGGLLKSLRSLNDHFGHLYINLGDPISLRNYLENESTHSSETLNPVDLQQITPEQFKRVQNVAEHVITLQQGCTVATITNLLAIVLMQSLMSNKCLEETEVRTEVEWTMKVLRNLGAKVFEKDVKGSVERILVIHRKLFKLDKENRLRLMAEAAVDVSGDMKKKMKGHILSSETMSTAIPIIQLQLYVNPILHYVVPPAIVCLIVHRGVVKQDELTDDYRKLRKLLSHEFFQIEKTEQNTLTNAIEYCVTNRVIAYQDEARTLLAAAANTDHKLVFLLKWAIFPALVTLVHCIQLMKEKQICEQNLVLKLVQQQIEASKTHPYCLSLEAIGNCLQGLIAVGALNKAKSQEEQLYEVTESIEEYKHLVNSVLPAFPVQFDRDNFVIYSDNTKSRL